MEEKNSNQDGRTWFSERKKMAVLVAAVVAICVAVFALSAYISSSGGGSKDDEPVPNNTEEIRMMNPFDEKIGGEEKNPGVLPPEKGAEDVPEMKARSFFHRYTRACWPRQINSRIYGKVSRRSLPGQLII